MKRALIAMLLLGWIGPACAEDKPIEDVPDAKACRVLPAQIGQRYSIGAHIDTGARLRFLRPVKTFEVSLPELWDVTAKGASLWLRPKQETHLGDKAGITVFLDNGREYDFLAYRDPAPSDVCVIVAPDPATARRILAGQPATSVKAREPDAVNAQVMRLVEAQVSALQQRQEAELATMRRQMESQATDRVKAFQHAINTNYVWGTRKNPANGLIEAVYDDGRFTYVRIATTAYGLPSLTARAGDQDLVLQYSYDDLTGVFEIQGLYDRIRLRIGNQSIDIDRRG